MDIRVAGYLAVVVLVAVAGAVAYRRKRARVRAERRELFRDARSLFTGVGETQDDIDFPVLSGERTGLRWRLEPVVDSLTYRKLPSLWLCVTCYADLEVAPVLLRPTATSSSRPTAVTGTSCRCPTAARRTPGPPHRWPARHRRRSARWVRCASRPFHQAGHQD